MDPLLWLFPMIFIAGAGLKARQAKRKALAAQRHSTTEALGNELKGSKNSEAAKEYLKQSNKNRPKLFQWS